MKISFQMSSWLSQMQAKSGLQRSMIARLPELAISHVHQWLMLAA